MTNNKTNNTGKIMAFITWIIGIALLTQLFGDWQSEQYNPNQQPQSLATETSTAVVLDKNRNGHYLSNGQINKERALFLVDTGATDVVIPEALSQRYNLTVTGKAISRTANGTITVYKTTLDSLSIGDITLYNVRANINPGMNKTQPVLLGMSALQRLEIRQQNGQLLLIKHQ